MQMPESHAEVLAKRERVVDRLREIVPGEGMIASEAELRAYECDGLMAYRMLPMAFVLPTSTEQVAAILRFGDDEKINAVPRGVGISVPGSNKNTANLARDLTGCRPAIDPAEL